mmetsp:Transcript_25378/g.59903  ORF Transcript_25378/g.59903 Transcript_25378/m.59903 type:complete len:244 (-) Transcript_25378:45-776(-)
MLPRLSDGHRRSRRALQRSYWPPLKNRLPKGRRWCRRGSGRQPAMFSPPPKLTSRRSYPRQQAPSKVPFSRAWTRRSTPLPWGNGEPLRRSRGDVPLHLHGIRLAEGDGTRRARRLRRRESFSKRQTLWKRKLRCWPSCWRRLKQEKQRKPRRRKTRNLPNGNEPWSFSGGRRRRGEGQRRKWRRRRPRQRHSRQRRRADQRTLWESAQEAGSLSHTLARERWIPSLGLRVISEFEAVQGHDE